MITRTLYITVVIIHTLSHDPDAQPKAQDEILGCCDTVDLMLGADKFCKSLLLGFLQLFHELLLSRTW